MLAEGDRVLVRERNTAWEPESGQTILDFSVGELAEKVAPLVKASAPQAKEQASTGEEWFELALEFDQVGAQEDAQAAYQEVAGHGRRSRECPNKSRTSAAQQS